MGVITFARPQDGLIQLQNAIEFIQLLRTIANDPQVGKTVDDLSTRLTNAQALSTAQQKAAADAQEIIAQAKEHIDDFEAKKAAHRKEVAANQEEIAGAYKQLNTDKEVFANEKKTMQELSTKIKADADAKQIAALKLSNEANLRLSQAQQLAADAAAKKVAYDAEHQQKLQDIAKMQKEAAIDINAKYATHDANVAALAKERAAFEAKKQKFEALMKE